MEDTATAEISRAQLWHWIRHGAQLSDGRRVAGELYREIRDEEVQSLRGEDFVRATRLQEAVWLLDELVLGDEFAEFLTIRGYGYLN